MAEYRRLTDEELDQQVRLLKDLEREASDLNVRIDNLKGLLKEEMTARGTTELKGEDWVVTWNTVTSHRLDQALLKQFHPKIYESCKVVSESRRFIVK